MKKMSPSTIKNTLDKWVSGVGTGRYQPGNYVDDLDNSFSISENFGIQQVKTEIYKFIDVLLKQKRIKNCLEIGLGAYGSTHFLWRLMFNKTITISILNPIGPGLNKEEFLNLLENNIYVLIVYQIHET